MAYYSRNHNLGACRMSHDVVGSSFGFKELRPITIKQEFSLSRDRLEADDNRPRVKPLRLEGLQGRSTYVPLAAYANAASLKTID